MAFSPLFVLLKVTCLVILFDHKLQVFQKNAKLAIFGIFDELLSHHIKRDFYFIFSFRSIFSFTHMCFSSCQSWRRIRGSSVKSGLTRVIAKSPLFADKLWMVEAWHIASDGKKQKNKCFREKKIQKLWEEEKGTEIKHTVVSHKYLDFFGPLGRRN